MVLIFAALYADGCARSHEIADSATVFHYNGAMENGYCGMPSAAATTMLDPASAAGWPSVLGGAFTAHTTFLKARCGN